MRSTYPTPARAATPIYAPRPLTAASDEAPEILLRHHLKKLKLPTVLREHEKIARQCAAEGLGHVRYLARLIELELLDREGFCRKIWWVAVRDGAWVSPVRV